jgi:hypothetical protein
MSDLERGPTDEEVAQSVHYVTQVWPEAGESWKALLEGREIANPDDNFLPGHLATCFCAGLFTWGFRDGSLCEHYGQFGGGLEIEIVPTPLGRAVAIRLGVSREDAYREWEGADG